MFLEDLNYSFDGKDSLKNSKIFSEEDERLYSEVIFSDLIKSCILFNLPCVKLRVKGINLLESFLNNNCLEYFGFGLFFRRDNESILGYTLLAECRWHEL